MAEDTHVKVLPDKWSVYGWFHIRYTRFKLAVCYTAIKTLGPVVTKRDRHESSQRNRRS